MCKGSSIDNWTMNDLLQINTQAAATTCIQMSMSTPTSPTTLSAPSTPNSSNHTETQSSKKQLHEKQHNHKRPSPLMDAATTPTSSKRAKAAMLMQEAVMRASPLSQSTNSSPSNSSSFSSSSSSSSSTSSSPSAPQLLQQLMAPTPQRARGGLINGCLSGKQQQSCGIEGLTKDQASNQWCLDSVEKSNLVAQQHASNSVLKNLLVSGYDVSAGYICILPMRPKKTAKA